MPFEVREGEIESVADRSGVARRLDGGIRSPEEVTGILVAWSDG